MRQRYLITWLLIWTAVATNISYAKRPHRPRVPSTMWLTDIKLNITSAGKARIQKMVNQLTNNQAAFEKFLNRVNLFAPIVERILKEEQVPMDFKYLVIQESGLVSDVVSSADAVGFWQFLDFTAREVGLKINEHVDERMHITMATRGAAAYLKANNKYLDNWVYTALSYFMGKGNVTRNYDCKYKKKMGVKRMRVDDKMHWYIIHLLAYKLVFQKKMGKKKHPELHLYEYPDVHGKTLSEISNTLGVNKKELQRYNKWLKRHRVPHDTTCVAIVPMTHKQASNVHKTISSRIRQKKKYDYSQYWEFSDSFPTVQKSTEEEAIVNGIPGIVASEEDTLDSLAQSGHISVKAFLRINDLLTPDEKVVAGQVYYYTPKHSSAKVHFHIARDNETWWSISQKYGVQKSALLQKNRLKRDSTLKPGRVVWLRFIRPSKVPIAYEYQKKD